MNCPKCSGPILAADCAPGMVAIKCRICGYFKEYPLPPLKPMPKLTPNAAGHHVEFDSRSVPKKTPTPIVAKTGKRGPVGTRVVVRVQCTACPGTYEAGRSKTTLCKRCNGRLRQHKKDGFDTPPPFIAVDGVWVSNPDRDRKRGRRAMI